MEKLPEAIPLEPDRTYDLPGGPHEGHGCALRVPVSTALAAYSFDRGDESPEALIEAEPGPEPLREMELGDDEQAVSRWESALNRPIHPLL